MLAIRSVQKYFTTGLDLNAEVLLGVKIPPSIGSLLDFGIGRQVEVLIRCCHFLNPCIHRQSKLSSDPLTLNIQNYVMNMLTSENRIKENSLGIPPVQLPGLVSSSKGSPLPASSVFYLPLFFFFFNWNILDPGSNSFQLHCGACSKQRALLLPPTALPGPCHIQLCVSFPWLRSAPAQGHRSSM